MNKIPSSVLVKNQRQNIETRFQEDGKDCRAVMVIRYDDECNNGHNTFSMTVTAWSSIHSINDKYLITGGANHDFIKEKFPEYTKYLKWHLVSSDEPVHYIANTLWHIGDTDCDGLKKGEYKAFKRVVMGVGIQDGKNTPLYTSGMMYTNKSNNRHLANSNSVEDRKIHEFVKTLKVKSVIVAKFEEWSKSEGKTVDLEYARNSAVWEDGTVEELGDKEKLIARLPKLMEEFKSDMEELGFKY